MNLEAFSAAPTSAATRYVSTDELTTTPSIYEVDEPAAHRSNEQLIAT